MEVSDIEKNILFNSKDTCKEIENLLMLKIFKIYV